MWHPAGARAQGRTSGRDAEMAVGCLCRGRRGCGRGRRRAAGADRFAAGARRAHLRRLPQRPHAQRQPVARLVRRRRGGRACRRRREDDPEAARGADAAARPAAAEISRLAVGDPDATAREATYAVSRWASQREHVEGAPYGTRGGVSVVHTFPADGDYRFRVSFYHETTGALYGNGRAALHTAEAPQQVEISVDGARAALLDIDRWMNTSDPDGVNLRSEPVKITAGPHRVSAAFIRRPEGPAQDLISPLDWSLASTSIADAYGFTTLPHLRDVAITGPFPATGVSETPSRRKVFSCHPGTA